MSAIADAITQAMQAAQDMREAVLPSMGNPASVVLKLSTNTSDELAAAVQRGGMAREGDAAGRSQRIQTCSVWIRTELLPGWATADALTNKGLCVTGGATFKIGTAHQQGGQLFLRCNRWPQA